jgi:hypothetical protein
MWWLINRVCMTIIKRYIIFLLHKIYAYGWSPLSNLAFTLERFRFDFHCRYCYYQACFPLQLYRTETYWWAYVDWEDVDKFTYFRVYTSIKMKSLSQVNLLAHCGSINQSTFTKFWNLKMFWYVSVRYAWSGKRPQRTINQSDAFDISKNQSQAYYGVRGGGRRSQIWTFLISLAIHRPTYHKVY